MYYNFQESGQMNHHILPKKKKKKKEKEKTFYHHHIHYLQNPHKRHKHDPHGTKETCKINNGTKSCCIYLCSYCHV